jgi:hypothetical protein
MLCMSSGAGLWLGQRLLRALHVLHWCMCMAWLSTRRAAACRDEIASCSEQAYTHLSLADAQKLMMLGSQKDVLAFAQKVRLRHRSQVLHMPTRAERAMLLVMHRPPTSSNAALGRLPCCMHSPAQHSPAPLHAWQLLPDTSAPQACSPESQQQH